MDLEALIACSLASSMPEDVQFLDIFAGEAALYRAHCVDLTREHASLHQVK